MLGYDSPREYLAKPQYFGATVGRYANRIARGKFTLDGQQYTLETNDGPNHLHGGKHGLDKVLWKIDEVAQRPARPRRAQSRESRRRRRLSRTLHVTATYTLSESNELTVEYRATTDKPTIVNITNHSYSSIWPAKRHERRARPSAQAVRRAATRRSMRR